MSPVRRRDITKRLPERLKDLDTLLRSGKRCTRAELAERWDLSVKQVSRDVVYAKKKLRMPVKYVPAEKTYKYEDPTYLFYGRSLTEAELRALLLASQMFRQYAGTPMARDVSSFLGKIADCLPGDMKQIDHLVRARTSFRSPPSAAVDEKIWRSCLTAVLESRKLLLDYRGIRDDAYRRWKVDPHHIVNLEGDWYLMAYDHERAEMCQIMIARAKKAVVLDESFEMQAGFDPAKVLRNTFRKFLTFRQSVTACIRVDACKAFLIKERSSHPKEKRIRHENGDIEVRFPVSPEGPEPFLDIIQWVLAFGGDAEVLGPPELRVAVQNVVEAMGRRYLKSRSAARKEAA